MSNLFAYRKMPEKPFWLNVYAGNELGAICTARIIATEVARITQEQGDAVLYRLHITPKDCCTVDLQDVYGYGPSAPGWKEPAR